jgi:hypothetical protein
MALAIIRSGGQARAHSGADVPDMAAAVQRAVSCDVVSGAIEPLYLRPPDAKPQEGKSLARAEA